jgi:hypothetical protein
MEREVVMAKTKRKTRSETKTVRVTLYAGKTSAGDLYGYAVPDPAEMFVDDTIRWTVVAKDGVTNVKPAHFRLKGSTMSPVPFTRPLRRKKGKAGAAEFTAKGKKSGFTRIYKYDIMVGKTVVADPDVQIKER